MKPLFQKTWVGHAKDWSHHNNVLQAPPDAEPLATFQIHTESFGRRIDLEPQTTTPRAPQDALPRCDHERRLASGIVLHLAVHVD